MSGPCLTRRMMLRATVAGVTSFAAASSAKTQTDYSQHTGPGISRLPAGKIPEARIPVAIMLDEGATMMDFAGPWEVFQDVQSSGGQGYFLYTVAPEMREYHTTGNMLMADGRHMMSGLAFTPDYTYATAPQPKIVVMGAQVDFDGKSKVAWLQKVAPKADVVLSVCTGNFIAGHSGLLDGLKATTHHAYFNMFASAFPRVDLIRDQRVVDNGKFVSGGGITAGIDAAIHVVRRYFDDKVVGEMIDYMEYRTIA